MLQDKFRCQGLNNVLLFFFLLAFRPEDLTIISSDTLKWLRKPAYRYCMVALCSPRTFQRLHSLWSDKSLQASADRESSQTLVQQSTFMQEKAENETL